MQIWEKGCPGSENSKCTLVSGESAWNVQEMARRPLCWSEGLRWRSESNSRGWGGQLCRTTRPLSKGGRGDKGRSRGSSWKALAKTQGDGNGSGGSGQILHGLWWGQDPAWGAGDREGEDERGTRGHARARGLQTVPGRRGGLAVGLGTLTWRCPLLSHGLETKVEIGIWSSGERRRLEV